MEHGRCQRRQGNSVISWEYYGWCTWRKVSGVRQPTHARPWTDFHDRNCFVFRKSSRWVHHMHVRVSAFLTCYKTRSFLPICTWSPTDAYFKIRVSNSTKTRQGSNCDFNITLAHVSAKTFARWHPSWHRRGAVQGRAVWWNPFCQWVSRAEGTSWPVWSGPSRRYSRGTWTVLGESMSRYFHKN